MGFCLIRYISYYDAIFFIIINKKEGTTYFLTAPTEPFVGNGNLHQEDAELRALKKRIKDLEEENEFLKKASAFFAKNLK